MKKLTFVELNEFNLGLLSDAAKTDKWPAIKKMISLNLFKTISPDVGDEYKLEPWVQWVSVHTGVPSSEHGVMQMGETPSSNYKQIWDRLSDLGVSYGLWSPMNSAVKDKKNCKFYLPDPWVFTEKAYPEELQYLLELPQYLVKNRSNILNFRLMPKLLKSLFGDRKSVV